MISEQHVDILLVTATEIETRAVRKVFGAPRTHAGAQSIEGRVYFDLGTINGTRVNLTQCEMGAGGLDASLQAISKGIAALSPAAVVMVGIAFGMSEKEQSLGDILITAQLRPYDLQRVGTGEDGGQKIILRGDKPHASPRLLNLFKSSAITWQGATLRFGTILSGATLVDNLDVRERLRTFEPEAIGGEMEGSGLYVACQDEKVDWILVKGICDFADGQKARDKDQRQASAARNAAAFVYHTLQFVQIDWVRHHRVRIDDFVGVFEFRAMKARQFFNEYRDSTGAVATIRLRYELLQPRHLAAWRSGRIAEALELGKEINMLEFALKDALKKDNSADDFPVLSIQPNGDRAEQRRKELIDLIIQFTAVPTNGTHIEQFYHTTLHQAKQAADVPAPKQRHDVAISAVANLPTENPSASFPSGPDGIPKLIPSRKSQRQPRWVTNLHAGGILLVFYGLPALPFVILMKSFVILAIFAPPAILLFCVHIYWAKSYVVRNFPCNIDWYAERRLPTETARLLWDVLSEHGITRIHFGVADEAEPNAFALGSRSSPIIIVTTGLLDKLSARELGAVLLHEVGHLVHGDFRFMTMVAVVPMFLGTIALGLLRVAFSFGGSFWRIPASACFLLGFPLGVLCVITDTIALWASRRRETYADRFAASALGTGDDLSRALFKIAEGASQLSVVRDVASAGALSRTLQSESDKWRALRLLAIADGVAFNMSGNNSEFALQVMRWNLENPWAIYYGLFLTHPFHSQRIVSLNELTIKAGAIPSYALQKARRHWGSFLIDLPLVFVPWLCVIAPVIVFDSIKPESRFHDVSPRVELIFLALLAVLTYVRIRRTHPLGQFHESSSSVLIADTRVSAIRSTPATIRGRIVPAGEGNAWSKWIVEDKSGRLPLLVPRFTLWFRSGLKQGLGQEIEIRGWYRRLPGVVFEPHSFVDPDSEQNRVALWPMAKLALLIVLVAGSILLLLVRGGGG